MRHETTIDLDLEKETEVTENFKLCQMLVPRSCWAHSQASLRHPLQTPTWRLTYPFLRDMVASVLDEKLFDSL